MGLPISAAMISASSFRRSECSSPTRRTSDARSATLEFFDHSRCAWSARAIASCNSSSVIVGYSLTVSPVVGSTTAYMLVTALLRQSAEADFMCSSASDGWVARLRRDEPPAPLQPLRYAFVKYFEAGSGFDRRPTEWSACATCFHSLALCISSELFDPSAGIVAFQPARLYFMPPPIFGYALR